MRAEMARTLAVSRVTVPAAAEPEYLRVVGELARVSEPRGRRLWVFRARGRGGAFLECSESRTAESHRAVAEPRDDERRLESRLHELAVYAPDAWDLWEEVVL
jgi:hypothetical protein